MSHFNDNTNRHATIRRLFDLGRDVPEEELGSWLLSVAPDCEQTRRELFGLLIADQTNCQQERLQLEPRWKKLADKYLQLGRIGSYQLVDLVGRGAAGFVFRAVRSSEEMDGTREGLSAADSESAGRFYAVKVCHPWGDETDEIRFRREQRALRTVHHACVARFVEAGVDEHATAYLVTDFIEGQNLEQRLRNVAGDVDVRSVPLAMRVSWFRMICEGVAAAHQHLILHRDLKPSNIIITPDDRAVVTDFGLAKRILPAPHMETQVTSLGQLLGTPAFMSPEQINGAAQLQLSSDVYGLGAILYFLLTGQPPHRVGNVAETFDAILHKAPLAPRSFDRTIPRDLETICLHALKKDAMQRYSSADAMHQDIARYEAGEPITARATSEWRRLWYWSRRKPLAAGLILAFTMLVLAGSMLIALFGMQARSAAREAQRRSQQLQNTIEEIAGHIRRTESDPTTLDLRADLLRTITKNYDQLAEEQILGEPLLRAAAGTNFKLGRVENKLGNREAALQAYRSAEGYFRDLTKLSPDNFVYRFDIFHALDSQRRLDDALVEITALLKIDPGNQYYLDAYCNTVLRLAEYDYQALKPDTRSTELDSVQSIVQSLADEFPNVAIFQRKVGQVHDLLARYHVMRRDLKSGAQHFRSATPWYERTIALAPQDEAFYYDFTRHLLHYLALVHHLQDRSLEAELLVKLEATSAYAFQTYSKAFEAWRLRAQTLHCQLLIAHEVGEEGRVEELRAMYEQCLRWRLRGVPDCAEATSRLAWLLSAPLASGKQLAEAEMLIERLPAEYEALIWDVKPLVHFRRGEFAAAAEIYRSRIADMERRYQHPAVSPAVLYQRAADALSQGGLPRFFANELDNYRVESLSRGILYEYLQRRHQIVNLEYEILAAIGSP